MARFLLSLTLILLFMPSLVADEISLTLDEALSIAIRDNRDILLKSEDVKKAKWKIEEAKANFYPSVTLGAGLTRTRSLFAKDITTNTMQAGAKQTIYDGGVTINTKKLSEYSLAASEAILDKVKSEISLNVKKGFYALLLAINFRDLNKKVLDNTNEHLQFLQERYKSGQASESDILSVKSSLSNVRKTYEESVNQIESARNLLNNLLYLDKDVKIVPAGEFTYERRDIAFDEAFLKAMEDRPEIRQYDAQEKAASRSVEIAKAGNRPTVYASWDYYNSSRPTAAGGIAVGSAKGRSDYNIVGVTFSWPIFDGWETKSKVEQAIADLKETQISKEKVIKDITLELANAYVGLKDAIAKIESTESDIILYEDNLSIVTEKYKEGITSLLDVSDATLKYDVSVFNKNQAIYDYLTAKSDFEKAAGGRI